MEKDIYIVRHGETDFNKLGIVQGSGVDSSLNAFGWKQAYAFYEFYKSLPFEVVLTSKLQRTHQTMKPFLDNNLKWEQFEDINEIDWGTHEGKESTPEMKARYQEMLDEWQAGNFHASLEQGESALQLQTRIKRFVDHLKTRSENLLLICTHGRAMRCLMSVLKDQDLREMENYKHANTGLYKVRLRDGQFEFELENDVRHLKVLEPLTEK